MEPAETTTAASGESGSTAASGENGSSAAASEPETKAVPSVLGSLKGSVSPTDEEIELANTTLDDSYLTDQFHLGSDYSAYPYKEDVTLTVWMPDGFQASTMWGSMDEHYVVKKVEELTGIHVKFTVPPAGDVSTSFNLMIAGNELPDIIFDADDYYGGGLTEALDDGLIVELGQYADSMPNYMSLLNSDEDRKRDSVDDNGSILCIREQASERAGVPFAMRIKKTALEKTGWTTIPETVDEWHDFLTACKEAGFSAPMVFGSTNGFITRGLGFLATAYGTSEGLSVKDGKVFFGPMEDGIADYLRTLNQWYEEGLIDPDFMSGNADHRQMMITSDDCAVILMNAAALEQMGVEYVTAPFSVLNKGDKPYISHYSSLVDNTYTAVVTSSCKNVEAALAYLDFGFTKKGYEIYNYGTYGDVHLVNEEGIPYYQEESLIFTDPEIVEKGGMYRDSKYKLQHYAMVRDEINSVISSKQSFEDALSILNSSVMMNLPVVSLTPEESDEVADMALSLNDIRSEYCSSIAVGALPVEAVEDMKQKLRDAGVERYVEIYQAAYDRYLQR